MRRPLGNQEPSLSKDRGFAEATRTRSGRKGPPGDFKQWASYLPRGSLGTPARRRDRVKPDGYYFSAAVASSIVASITGPPCFRKNAYSVMPHPHSAPSGGEAGRPVIILVVRGGSGQCRSF